MSDEEADVVVIGSGMGGLAAARTIAQFGGKRVLVLEQHYTLGGMTHEFSRAGRYRFGTGLHYMSASAGPFLGFMTDGRAQLAAAGRVRRTALPGVRFRRTRHGGTVPCASEGTVPCRVRRDRPVLPHHALGHGRADRAQCLRVVPRRRA